MDNTILQRVKSFATVKMINHEKFKQEKCQPSPLRKTCPCTILPPPFFNFSDSPSSVGGNQNLLPLLKKEGGGGRVIQTMLTPRGRKEIVRFFKFS